MSEERQETIKRAEAAYEQAMTALENGYLDEVSAAAHLGRLHVEGYASWREDKALKLTWEDLSALERAADGARLQMQTLGKDLCFAFLREREGDLWEADLFAGEAQADSRKIEQSLKALRQHFQDQEIRQAHGRGVMQNG